MTNPPESIMAIDPGTKKIGLAILKSNGSILHKCILRMDNTIEQSIKSIFDDFNPDVIILGDGTGSGNLLEILKNIPSISSKEIKLVKEQYSTEEARKIYLAKFSSIKRFFLLLGYVAGLYKLDFDDEAAILLGKNYLNGA